MARWLARLGHRVMVVTTSAYGQDPSGPVPLDPGDVGEAEGAGGGALAVSRTGDLQLLRARLHGHERVDSMFDADTYSGRPHPLSRVIVPEPLRVAWEPLALLRARRLAAQLRVDCVITTSPPESAHRIGRVLGRQGFPWVADVRDAWTFEPLRPRFPTAAQRRLDARLERRWLGAADVVTCVSRPAAEDLRERGIADPLLVPNGWEPDLAGPADEAVPPSLDSGRVSLVYTGRFGSHGRDPAPLVAALGRLAAESPEAAARVELVVAGPLTERERALLDADVSPARIVVLGSLERPRALALQRAADALLVLASPTRSQLANLKLFEYLAADRPILAIAGGTEAGRIVEEAGGVLARADDETSIVTALRRLAAQELAPPRPESRERYSYPALAERMAEAVELAIERRADRGGRRRRSRTERAARQV
jgi:glycosyltransferase involved in cell wall biosynthesis